MKQLLLLPVSLMLALSGLAQVPVNGPGSYSQNFDGLITTGSTTWADNSTLSSWFAARSGAGSVTLIAGDGSSNTGGVYSFGTGTAAERALGAIGSGTPGTQDYAVELQNTGATGVTGFTFSFTMEQWRNGGNTSAQPLAFYYKKSTSAITALNPGTNGTWTAVTALNTTSPVNTATAAALDGNASANRVTVSGVVIPGLTLNPGEYIMFKWEDINDSGNDHGLSIDDLTITWVGSCATQSTISASACGSYTVPSGDETYTASGTYHDTIPNAALCDSVITINLTILNATTSTISPVACGSYTVPSGDETYTTAGTYMDTIPNAAGCDSILTINLTFSTSITYYLDNDGDGYGNPAVTSVGCAQPSGYVTNDDDCNDNNAAITIATTMYYTDADGDGLGDPATGVTACSQPAGTVANANDCDDTDNLIGAATMWYADADNDGYGDPATGTSNCTQPTGYVADNTDCNDASAAIHPGATEIADNGIDEDCSGGDLVTSLGQYTFTGSVDCTTQVLTATGVAAHLTFSEFSASDSVTCSPANNVFNNTGWNTGSTVNTDEYAEFTIYPDDCYAMDFTNLSFKHRTSATGLNPTVHVRSSVDNFTADLFTATITTVNVYESVSQSLSLTGVTDSITFRFYVTNIGSGSATYRLDDVAVSGSVNALSAQTYYADADGDSFGDPAVAVTDCTQPDGYVSDNTDCNDSDATEYPGAIWYADMDNDTYGDPTNYLVSCTQPAGYVSNMNGTDCDDTDNTILASVAYYPDLDNDGYGDASATPTLACVEPVGFVTDNTDCDDNNIAVHPGATEICDGLDNNCNGTIDEGLTTTTYYQDADNDGFGNPVVTAVNCEQPVGYTTDHSDCDDNDATIYPGAADIAGNGVDENCDGVDGVLGLNEVAGASLNVFPNPGSETLNIAIEGFDGNVNVELISAEGKAVISRTAKLTDGAATIATAELNPGVYLIRVSTDTENAVVRWIKN